LFALWFEDSSYAHFLWLGPKIVKPDRVKLGESFHFVNALFHGIERWCAFVFAIDCGDKSA
jgi:hypothetical protein